MIDLGVDETEHARVAVVDREGVDGRAGEVEVRDLAVIEADARELRFGEQHVGGFAFFEVDIAEVGASRVESSEFGVGDRDSY